MDFGVGDGEFYGDYWANLGKKRPKTPLPLSLLLYITKAVSV